MVMRTAVERVWRSVAKKAEMMAVWKVGQKASDWVARLGYLLAGKTACKKVVLMASCLVETRASHLAELTVCTVADSTVGLTDERWAGWLDGKQAVPMVANSVDCLEQNLAALSASKKVVRMELCWAESLERRTAV